MRKYLVVIVMVLAALSGHAQTNQDSAVTVFKKLCKKYENADYLSFRLAYSYADAPGSKFSFDSLIGNVMINRANYHMLLGNTEIIHNHNYNIILFKSDTLMYLTKPDTSKTISNPVSLIDTMLLKISGMSLSLKYKKEEEIVTMNFPVGMDYRKADFFIDPVTGYLARARYIVKTTLMINPADRAAANSLLQDKWGMVESNFFHYETGRFNDSEFDDKKYFIKDGSTYKTTDAYKQYKIFIASPDL